MTQIVFNSQKEFEDAVMEVLQQRLDIEVDKFFGGTTVRVRLVDVRCDTKKLICQDSAGYN